MHPTRDVLASLFGALSAHLWTNLLLAVSPILTPKLHSPYARKLMHTTAAPLFLLTLPLYSPEPSARLFAAAVPLISALRLFRSASAASHDPLGSAVARGERREARQGPFVYAVMVGLGVGTGWGRGSMIVGLGAMAFGDGAAGVIGSAAPVVRWASGKSFGGSLSFLGVGTLGSWALLRVLSRLGTVSAVPGWIVGAAVAVAAVVEMGPWEDNFAVPLAAAGAAEVLMAVFGTY